MAAAAVRSQVRFAGSVLAYGVDVVVADALVPFVPSLLAMGCSDPVACAFVAELTGLLAPVQPVLVVLNGDIKTALARAAAREPGRLSGIPASSPATA